MGGSKKGNAKKPDQTAKSQPPSNYSAPARNLRKTELAGVIFGCKNNTIDECYSKQLFGLPSSHIAYVRNITPGLVLFLFNYSDRTLHGIFEASSYGQMNIDPHGWTDEGTACTPYPAQVRVRIQKQCNFLTEEQFKPIIANNYYEHRLFWFELDQAQTTKLITLFSSSPVNANTSFSLDTSKWDPPSHSTNNPGTRRAHDVIDNWESSTDFGHSNQPVVQWSELEELSESKFIEEEFDNLKLKCQRSYSSVVGNTSTSVPERKWSSLFKTSSAADTNVEVKSSTNETSKSIFPPPSDQYNVELETPGDETCMDRVSNNSWEADGDKFATWESNNPESSDCTKVADSVPQTDTIDTSIDDYTRYEVGQCKNLESGSNLPVSDETIRNWDSDGEAQSSHGYAKEMYDDEAKDVDTRENHEEKSDHQVERCSSVADMVKELKDLDTESPVFKLIQQIEELKASQLKQIIKISCLEKELVESKEEIQQLKERFNAFKFGPSFGTNHVEIEYEELHRPDQDVEESVLVVGGFNGSSWLLDTDAYCPSRDQVKSLSPMNSLRKYASAAKSNGAVYVFGGVFGEFCSDTVEAYNLASDRWVPCSSLRRRRGCLAGASLHDKVYAIGGGNGTEFFSEVETFDPNIGKWTFTQSMKQARIGPAATEMNGVLYVVGGCYGGSYLNSVERFDPRENLWTGVGSMRICRGCHSLVALNEKLYAIGGYDGFKMVPTVEIFDPRAGSWMMGDPMNNSRGYSGAFTVAERLYVIGGMKNDKEFLDTIECYKEGRGWEITGLNGISKRCHFSALLM